MGLVKTRRLAAMQMQQRAKAGMKPPTQRYSQLDKRSRKDKKELMRSLALLLVVLAGPTFARTIVIPTQPVSPYLDTEVCTNCVLHRSRIDARTFDVHFQFEGTPTESPQSTSCLSTTPTRTTRTPTPTGCRTTRNSSYTTPIR